MDFRDGVNKVALLWPYVQFGPNSTKTVLGMLRLPSLYEINEKLRK